MLKKNDEFKLLDHGYLRFIDSMGTDETIIEAARMSTQGGFVSWEPYEGHVDGDAGLLEYLYRNNHATPFEMCELCIEVQAPIMVYREWHRSRTQSYNEMSARYTQMPNLHYVPDKSRLQAVKSTNKQEISVGDKYFPDLDTALASIAEEQDEIYHFYEQMLEHGVPKEVARINTPVSRYSRMRAKTDLRNWLHFLNLRQRPNAQWEIRQYANCLAGVIQQLFPRTFHLYEEYTLYARSFSRKELTALYSLFNDYGEASTMLRNLARKVGFKDKRVEELMKKVLTPADQLI